MKVHHPGATAMLCLATIIVALAAIAPASAHTDIYDLTAAHPWLPWPDVWASDHPLLPVVESVLRGDWRKQPAWKLPMLVNGLRKEPEQATITAYCSQCCDGGGRYTRWGSRVRRGICAADPRYWGPGSVIWIGPPVNEVVIVEDTGGAIRGPWRFDVCMEGNHAMCERIGRTTTICVPLYRVEPTSRWGDKPAGWHPPIWALPPDEDS